MKQLNLSSKKYNLDGFIKILHEWIDSFQIDKKSGHFAVKRGKNKPSLYGLTDMIFNLKITNEFETYFKNHDFENIEEWIKIIQSYQHPNSGWFKEGLINYGFHFKEHSTAFAV